MAWTRSPTKRLGRRPNLCFCLLCRPGLGKQEATILWNKFPLIWVCWSGAPVGRLLSSALPACPTDQPSLPFTVPTHCKTDEMSAGGGGGGGLSGSQRFRGPLMCALSRPMLCPGERSCVEKSWHGIGQFPLCPYSQRLTALFGSSQTSEHIWVPPSVNAHDKWHNGWCHSTYKKEYTAMKNISDEEPTALLLSRTTFRLNAVPTEMVHVLCWGVYPSASSHFTAPSRLLGSGLIEMGKEWEWWNVQQIIIYGGDALKLLQHFCQHLGEYTLFIPRVFKLEIQCFKNSLTHFVVWL